MSCSSVEIFVMKNLPDLLFAVLAPCTVQDVLSHVDCSSNSLIVSWSPGSMPLTYSVTAQDGDSNTLSCTTEESTCAVTGLECGEQYTVTVQAASGRCEGESSVAQTVDSGMFSIYFSSFLYTFYLLFLIIAVFYS